MRITAIFLFTIVFYYHDAAASPTDVVRLTVPVKAEVLVVEPVVESVVVPVVKPVVVEESEVVIVDVTESPTPVLVTEVTTTKLVVPSFVVNSHDAVGTKQTTYVDDAGVVRWGGCGYKGYCNE